MQHLSGGDAATARLDARLVPAALTSWAVTAAGILWPIGSCRRVGVCGGERVRRSAVACRAPQPTDAGHRHRPASPLVWSGAGFGFAIALRANAVARHPVTAAFGTAAQVVVTPTESALSVGSGRSARLMFRATLQQLGDDQISGRVVVFAPARDFSAVMVGQPVRFRARITRPARHDLTVAVVNAIGQPDDGSCRAGAPGRARSSRGIRCRSPSSAARRPSGDAACAGTRRHLNGQHGNQPRIPHGRVDAPHGGVRGQRHDRVRRGAVHVAADRAAGGGGAGRRCPGAVRHRRAAHGQRAARGGDGRDRAGGRVVFAAAASDSGSGRHGVGVDGRRPSVGRRRGPGAVGGGDGGAGGHRADLVAASGGGRLAQAVGGRCLRCMRRAVGDGSADRRHLGPGEPGGRCGQSRSGGADRADHRAGQRRRRTVPVLADRGATADPVHRARGVVGAADCALGSRCARRQRARSVRDSRCR